MEIPLKTEFDLFRFCRNPLVTTQVDTGFDINYRRFEKGVYMGVLFIEYEADLG